MKQIYENDFLQKRHDKVARAMAESGNWSDALLFASLFVESLD